MAISKYDLDINKQAIMKPVVILRQGDYGIDTMQVSLSVANEPMDLTGATIKFMGTTAGGKQIIDDVHVKIIDAKGGVFEYVFPSEAASDIGGYRVAYFSIIQANGQSSTMDFRVQVLSGVDISAPAASEYITHYDTMVTALNSAYDSFVNETDEKMASTVSSLATSAATVLDSALARVNDIDSTANNASSVASNAVSMASSVASTVTSQASYINSVAASAASNVSSVAAGVVDKLNNISVGGRNLLTGTSGELQTKQFTNSWNVGPQATNGNYKIKLVSGQTYTYRVWIDNTNGPDVAFTNVRFNPIGGTEYNLGNGSSIAQGQTGYSTLSMTPSQDGYACFIPFAYGALEKFSAGWKEEKLEKGNVPTDWTPAPEDVNTAMGAYIKKTNALPAEAHDFNYLATHMKTYQGTWWNAAEPILNAPKDDWIWSSIEIVAGNGESSGLIRTTQLPLGDVYMSNVDNGVLKGWKKVADDANVVHKTGPETIAGDKTFVNTPVYLDDNSTIIEDTYTRITVVKVRGVVSVSVAVKAATPNNGSYYVDLPTWANSNALYNDTWIYLSTQPNADKWNVSVRLNGAGNRVTRIGFNAVTPVGFAYTTYSA